jgi:hypothetical protein
VDEDVGTLREQLKTLTEKVDTNASNIQRYWAESLATFLAKAFEAICKIRSQLILVFGIMLPEGLWLLKLLYKKSAESMTKSNLCYVLCFCFFNQTLPKATWMTLTRQFPNAWMNVINTARQVEHSGDAL